MERNLSEKAEDKFEEMKLKAQAKAADFSGDESQQFKKGVQAKAKATSNNMKDAMEKQSKINQDDI